ncbi:hypothetical protein [Aliiglaciecola litoralis]|uniref:Uncharacterized protein n=1 Tax=Aliiglaciecola litoralis TaxID=582857 RepID=A0ABN1LHW2_9ALTE
MNVLILIGVLFISLIVIVPLIERSNFRMSNEQMGKWGKWILPMAIVLIIVQIIMYMSRS